MAARDYRGNVSWTKYSVDEDGEIKPEQTSTYIQTNSNRPGALTTQKDEAIASIRRQEQKGYSDAILKSNQIKIKKLQDTYEQRLADVTSREGTYNTLAEQIAALGGGKAGGTTAGVSGPAFNDVMAALGAQRNFGASDLASRLNFQVSDEQILNDVNNSRLGRLNNVVRSGNAQIAGINERLNTARNLLNQLPAGDPRRASSEVVVNQLTSDLKSVTEAVTDASEQIKNFKPLEMGSEQGLREIVAFREYIQLPEERAMDQIQQIDPDTFQAARSLGSRFRDFATQDIGSTADPRTEQLRGALEDLAFQELQLGGRLSPEETRMVQQAVRGRQAQLGNVDGMGPFSEEFAALGMASDQRRLGRAQNALSLLASGQTRSDEARRDKSFRDAANLARMGAASDFIAAGPSAMNLANQRVANQNSMFQNYVASNQANPGSFNPQANQIPFYQTADPMAGFRGAQTGANIYGSLADYQARTYGAYAGAQAQVASANATPNYIQAFSSLVPSFSF